jgi:hypothetical protein
MKPRIEMRVLYIAHSKCVTTFSKNIFHMEPNLKKKMKTNMFGEDYAYSIPNYMQTDISYRKKF